MNTDNPAPDAPVANAPVVEAKAPAASPDDGKRRGLEDLTDAFAAKATARVKAIAKEEAEATPVAPAGAPTTDDKTAVANAVQPTPQVDPVAMEQARIQAAIAKDRAEQQAIAEANRQRALLDQMDDASFGRYMRQFADQKATMDAMSERIAVQFHTEAINDIIATVPELKQLTAAEAKELDVQNRSSYGDLVGAMIRIVAKKMAGGEAKKMATEQFESWKTQELAKMGQEYPRQIITGGSVAGLDPLPIDTGGDQQLRHLFAAQAARRSR